LKVFDFFSKKKKKNQQKLLFCNINFLGNQRQKVRYLKGLKREFYSLLEKKKDYYKPIFLEKSFLNFSCLKIKKIIKKIIYIFLKDHLKVSDRTICICNLRMNLILGKGRNIDEFFVSFPSFYLEWIIQKRSLKNTRFAWIFNVFRRFQIEIPKNPTGPFSMQRWYIWF